MRTRWRFMLTILAIFVLSACGVSSQSTATQAPDMPVAALKSQPAHGTEGSALPLTDAATDPAMLPQDPPDTCPITIPPEPPFVPPPPYSPNGPSGFWYGTDSLWTAVPSRSVWSGLPHNPEGNTQKVFWWRKGYVWKDEPEPDLSVTGQRVDAPTAPLHVSKATNAFASDIQSAMLVGVDFPTLGCWKITGRYAGIDLSFVVWIAP